jgi:SpoVK/Ycf46/Vps4 family AAA+-type ATPase
MFRGQYHVSDLDDLIPNDPKVHDVLSMDHANAESLVGLFLERSNGTELTANDFSHLQDALEDLSTIIRTALEKREKGVNVLFYGPPGTGKTQLSRLIAQSIGCSLYEVRWSDDQREPATATERLMGLELGQNFLKHQANSFLLFDEVEAVFEGENDGMGSLSRLLGDKGHARNENKAWINQTLDNNSVVPTIWIANEIDRFDPAFLRRFIYCLEFKIPPRRVRRRAIDRYLGESNLSEDFKDRLSAQWISAAQIEMALRSTRLLKLTDQRETETAVLRSIKASMAVMGQEFVDEARTASSYRLDYLNVESPIPIERWGEVARNGHPLTICLAGPPGAGKTELARYLADQLDKPLLAKRGSDLLSKWVGGTEAQLAAMFREAKEEQAILLLDEADSMLRNREQASQAWQVSQVNELLQQMEGFNGIFICTTNRFEDLDPAALRRFSLKVRFHAMTPKQRWMFLLEITGRSENNFPEAAHIRLKLDRLEGVTPGDFAVAQRQFQMLNKTPDPLELLTTLEQEVRAKNWNSQQKAIGFLH